MRSQAHHLFLTNCRTARFTPATVVHQKVTEVLNLLGIGAIN